MLTEKQYTKLRLLTCTTFVHYGRFRNDIKTSERKISLIGCTLSKAFKSA